MSTSNLEVTRVQPEETSQSSQCSIGNKEECDVVVVEAMDLDGDDEDNEDDEKQKKSEKSADLWVICTPMGKGKGWRCEPCVSVLSRLDLECH